jgi:hypothetical protein
LQADRAALISVNGDSLTASPIRLPTSTSRTEQNAARRLRREARFELDRDVAIDTGRHRSSNPLAIIEVAGGLTLHKLVGSAAGPTAP